MGDGVYANLYIDEGTVSGDLTVTLTSRARRMTIMNDSSTKDLKFKFNTQESYGTLKPTETVSFQFVSKTIHLQGTNVPYRIWGVG